MGLLNDVVFYRHTHSLIVNQMNKILITCFRIIQQTPLFEVHCVESSHMLMTNRGSPFPVPVTGDASLFVDAKISHDFIP